MLDWLFFFFFHFCPQFHLAEIQMISPNGDPQHVLRYWHLDNSITCQDLSACVLTRLGSTWSYLTTVTTGRQNLWLMDRLHPVGMIIAEAHQAVMLFSHLDFVIPACLTMPDQYSIKHFFIYFAFSCSIAFWGQNTQKAISGLHEVTWKRVAENENCLGQYSSQWDQQSCQSKRLDWHDWVNLFRTLVFLCVGTRILS